MSSGEDTWWRRVTWAMDGIKLNRRFNQNIAGPGPTPLVDRRPHPGFSDILDSQNDGRSNYNGFNFQVNKPMSHGFLLVAAYTYGKELNIGDYAEYVHRDDTAGKFHRSAPIRC